MDTISSLEQAWHHLAYYLDLHTGLLMLTQVLFKLTMSLSSKALVTLTLLIGPTVHSIMES